MKKHQRKTDPRGFSSFLWLRPQLYFLLLVAVALMVVAIASAIGPLNKNVINSEKNDVFPGKWQCSVDDAPFVPVTLPTEASAPRQGKLVLKNQLPDEIVKGATVLLRTSQQDVVVFVNGVKIYDGGGEPGEPHMPASAYHFVRLPGDCAKQTILVELRSPFPQHAGALEQIYIGSKASNIFFLIRENGLRFTLGFLVFSIGFLGMLAFLFTKNNAGKAPAIYLAAFFTCTGFWLLVESTMTQFIIPYPAAMTNLSIFALSLLPVFSGLYYFSARTSTMKRTGHVIVTLALFGSFLMAVVACLQPQLPLRFLSGYLVFMGLYSISLLGVIVVQSFITQRFFSLSVWGILLFFVCGLLELVFYWIALPGYHNNAFLTLGLLLLCVFMLVDTLKNMAQVHQAAVQVEAYKALAYTDSLTGLQNRTAFLARIEMLSAQGIPLLSLAMFDVNDLKIVNDTLGHLTGDAMLRHCAKAIKSSLRLGDELYRIGGDEFAAILRHGMNPDLPALETRIASTLQAENQRILSYPLSIAYGYATYRKETDKTLFETLARADSAMYLCKKRQKQQKKSE